MKNSSDVFRVRDNRINHATPLVRMSSLYMHQLLKSIVNWNIYNDNIMTSGVAQLKNSRSSLGCAARFLLLRYKWLLGFFNKNCQEI